MPRPRKRARCSRTCSYCWTSFSRPIRPSHFLERRRTALCREGLLQGPLLDFSATGKSAWNDHFTSVTEVSYMVSLEYVKKYRQMPWIKRGMRVVVSGEEGHVAGGQGGGNIAVKFPN